MKNYLQELKDDAWRLGPDIVEMSDYVLDSKEFQTWSGSSTASQHHYGKGGLIRHSYEVIHIGYSVIDLLQPTVTKQEMFLAGLYHDVGKVKDYIHTDEEMSDWISTIHKRNIHHISRSAIMWTKAVTELGLFKELEDSILHAILSHHGCREWGSPVAPNSQLAWLLHLSDGLSARMDDCTKCDYLDIVKNKVK